MPGHHQNKMTVSETRTERRMRKLILLNVRFKSIGWQQMDCGGGGSLNISAGGLEMKRVKSPDKQAKAGWIKSATLFAKPPTAALEPINARLHGIFTLKVAFHIFLVYFRIGWLEQDVTPRYLNNSTMLK